MICRPIRWFLLLSLPQTCSWMSLAGRVPSWGRRLGKDGEVRGWRSDGMFKDDPAGEVSRQVIITSQGGVRENKFESQPCKPYHDNHGESRLVF